MNINTEELVKLTGATRRQILYWVEQGIIESKTSKKGSGYYYRFDENIVGKVKLLVSVSDSFRDILRKVSDAYEEGQLYLDENLILSWSKEEA